jgi:tRNA C32,U32 (ribose-2'-O)-methylase TrmJ
MKSEIYGKNAKRLGVTPAVAMVNPKALYIFGPEDGSIPQSVLKECHRFVVIPTKHCVNLAAAVYLVLYDRQVKLLPDLTIADCLAEQRFDFPENAELAAELGLA